jgi:hypothetical protein
MSSRRSVLHLIGASMLAASTWAYAQAPVRSAIERVVGRWKVSPTREATGPSDHATVVKITDGSARLSLEGELAKLLGGPVEVSAKGQGRFVGASKSGLEVVIAAGEDSLPSLTLRGQGVHFALYLVK